MCPSSLFRSGWLHLTVLFVFALSATAEVAPSVVWANRAGGTLPDSAHAIAADAAGNLYVAGVFGGTATFGATTLTAPQGKDLFLAKLGPTGAWLWAKNVEALVPGIYRFHLLVDSAGNPVLMTSIPGDAVGDGLSMLFIAKFNSAGAVTWSKKFKPGGLSSVIGGGLALDAANNVYVTGAFGSSVNFGGTTLTDSGNGDIFVLKLSAAGATVAAKQFGQPGTVADEGQAIALDTAGNVYLAAGFGGTASFGATALTSAGEADVALVKLDPGLNPLWAKRVGNSGADSAFELARDAANNLLLLGSFSTDTMLGATRITENLAAQLTVARFNIAGDFSWVTPLGASSVSGSGSRGFVPDASGNLLIATGGRLLKLDPAGAITWNRNSDPNFAAENLNGVAVQNYTNVFVAGSFSGTAKLDAVTLTSAGGDDALIARLFINTTPPPVVTVQPKERTVLTGTNVTFSVTATGAGPLRYQWYFGNQAIGYGTNATVTLTNVNLGNTGVYYVKVSNAGGTTDSAIVQLSVNIRPPTITQQPLSQTVDLGGEAQFTVQATGLQPFFYQWQLRGTNLSQQNTSLLVVRGARTIDAGPYTVLVGNQGGYTTSSVASLTVRVIPPTITIQPKDIVTTEGASINFAVAVSGSGPFTFRWLRDGKDVPNGASATLNLNSVTDADAGSYAVIVSNAAGSTTSLPATLSLLQPNLTGEPFSWSFLMAGPCGGAVTGLTTDAAGNIYLTSNAPDILLPGLTNATSCRYGFAVAKLDANGRGIWRNFAVGTSSLKVTVGNIRVDAAGNLLVAGSFTGTAMNFGPAASGGPGPSLTTGGLFLAKFGPTGAVLWAKKVAGASAADLVVDAAGNTFIAGTLSASATAAFGTTNITTTKSRPFLAKADPAGTFTWVRPAGSQTTGAQARSLALDPSGDLWLLGSFSGTLEFGTDILTSVFPPPRNLSARTSAFLARVGSGEGLSRWVRMFQTKDQVLEAHAVGAHPAGGAVIALNQSAEFNYPPVVTWDVSGGVVFRVDSDGKPLSGFFSAYRFKQAAVGSDGAVLLSSELPGETFGDFTLPRPNGQNIAAMLKLGPDLTPQLARSVSGLKGLEYATPAKVAFSPSGDALLAGSFTGTNVVFGPLVTRSAIGGGAFLAKLGAPALPAVTGQIVGGRLSLTWPHAGGWVLERVTTLGGTFAPFTFTGTTNTANGTVTVDLPLDAAASFFRLRQP